MSQLVRERFGVSTTPAAACLWLVLLLVFATGSARAASPVTAAAENRRESNFCEVEGVKLHYLVEGAGEPVVLIHGLHGSAQTNWVLTGITAELARKYQVIALDLPGHGESDKPEDADAYGTQMVDDVVALLDHLHIDKAHIVGYSMGGMVTMKLSATHPERVRTAIVGGMGWLREGSRLQRFWEQVPEREGARTPTACVHGLAKLAISEDDLLAIKTPAEIIVGDRDPVQRMYVAPLRRVRKDWPVVEVRDAGHINCIAKPEFRDVIAAWLARHAGR